MTSKQSIVKYVQITPPHENPKKMLCGEIQKHRFIYRQRKILSTELHT